MVIDAGRIKHLGDLMHKSIASNGSAVSSNWRLSADGLTNVVWTPESAGGGVSYGSNSNEVSYANAPGASTLVSRTDHVHRGVTSVAVSSNTLVGPITLAPEGQVGLTVAGQTIKVNVVGSGAGGGGGSLTQAYEGYNTVGGSQENWTPGRVLAKKITLANACQLSAISAYVDGGVNNNNVDGFMVGVYADAAGTPSNLIAIGGWPGTTVLLDNNGATAGGNTTGRWLAAAIGEWLTAGDYWIAVGNGDQPNSAALRIYYDGSGTDRYYTPGGTWFADWGNYTPTTTTNKYSIRANTIR